MNATLASYAASAKSDTASGPTNKMAQSIEIVTTSDNLKVEKFSTVQKIHVSANALRLQLPEHHLRILFLLRMLKIRLLKHRLLGVLNYFRSVEKKLVFDDHGFAFEDKLQLKQDLSRGMKPKNLTSASSPTPLDLERALPSIAGQHSTTLSSVDLSSKTAQQSSVPELPSYVQAQVHQSHFGPSDVNGISDATFMKFMGIEHRDDTIIRDVSGQISVLDPFSIPIVYDVAIGDSVAIQSELLHVASHYIAKERKNREKEMTRQLHLPNLRTETGQLIAENVDREQFILDLFELEYSYQQSKCRLLDTYLEAYEHCTSRSLQKQLATMILKISRRRPRYDLDASSAVDAYRAEISLFRSQAHFLGSLFSVWSTSSVWSWSGSFAGYGVVLAGADIEDAEVAGRQSFLTPRVVSCHKNDVASTVMSSDVVSLNDDKGPTEVHGLRRVVAAKGESHVSFVDSKAHPSVSAELNRSLTPVGTDDQVGLCVCVCVCVCVCAASFFAKS